MAAAQAWIVPADGLPAVGGVAAVQGELEVVAFPGVAADGPVAQGALAAEALDVPELAGGRVVELDAPPGWQEASARCFAEERGERYLLAVSPDGPAALELRDGCSGRAAGLLDGWVEPEQPGARCLPVEQGGW